MYGPGGEGGLPLPWLQNIYHTVSSLGQMTEMLGMNTEALGYLFSSFMGFLETVSNVMGHIRQGAQFEHEGAMTSAEVSINGSSNGQESIIN